MLVGYLVFLLSCAFKDFLQFLFLFPQIFDFLMSLPQLFMQLLIMLIERFHWRLKFIYFILHFLVLFAWRPLTDDYLFSRLGKRFQQIALACTFWHLSYNLMDRILLDIIIFIFLSSSYHSYLLYSTPFHKLFFWNESIFLWLLYISNFFVNNIFSLWDSHFLNFESIIFDSYNFIFNQTDEKHYQIFSSSLPFSCLISQLTLFIIPISWLSLIFSRLFHRYFW